MVCADDPFHVDLASEVGQAAGIDIPMVVDVNVGMDRTGVVPATPPSSSPAASTARRASASPGSWATRATP